MQSITIIRNEHRNLGAVLYSLDRLVEQIEEGKKPKFEVFHGLLMYIDRFLDRYHHPKENDYLFPALRRQLPESAELLDELIQQHRDGERMFNEVLKALSAYEFAGENEFAAFRDALYRYTKFEKEHAMKEEREVIPLVEKHLTEEDWTVIDAAFTGHRDPMFSKVPTRMFEKLHRDIVAAVPAPFGLGEQWKTA